MNKESFLKSCFKSGFVYTALMCVLEQLRKAEARSIRLLLVENLNFNWWSQLYAPAQKPFVSKHCNYQPPANHQSSPAHTGPGMATHLTLPQKCHLPLGTAGSLVQLQGEVHLCSTGLLCKVISMSVEEVQRWDTEGKDLKHVWFGLVFSLVELEFSFRIFISRSRHQQNQALKVEILLVSLVSCP